MIKIKIQKESLFSPLGIYIFYILASGLVIMGFRFIFPGEAVPLAFFSVPWRLIKGFLEFISLFPALTLTALVIPFGFKIQAQEKNNPYSPQFLQSLKMSIVTAITAAMIYGLLFSLALPIARNYEANLLFQSRLYLLAKERAQENAASGDWVDAAQFIAICERIWPNGKDHNRLKVETEIRTEESHLTPQHIQTDAASGTGGIHAGGMNTAGIVKGPYKGYYCNKRDENYNKLAHKNLRRGTVLLRSCAFGLGGGSRKGLKMPFPLYYFLALRRSRGFTALPFLKTAKWRWGPVVRPLSPTVPICAPWITGSPFLTEKA